MEVTAAMERHIQERIDRLPPFEEETHNLRITVTQDSGEQHVEIVAKCHKSVLVANARSHDVYEAIDESFDKLERQLMRCHDKLVNRRSREAQQASEDAKQPR